MRNDWDNLGMKSTVLYGEDSLAHALSTDLLPIPTRDFSFEDSSKNVERHLLFRSKSFELEDRNIFRANPHVAPSIQSVQQSLKFKKTGNAVLHKLEHRPAPDELLQKNILKYEPNKADIAPGIQAVQQMLKFHQTMDTIDTKLQQRSDRTQLIESHILEANVSVPTEPFYSSSDDSDSTPSFKFQTTTATFDYKIESRSPPKGFEFISSQSDEDYEYDDEEDEDEEMYDEEDDEDNQTFEETAALVDQKLEHRPRRSELLESNIMKGDSVTMASSLLATQQALSKHKMNDNLNLKLKLRPTADDLMDHNILKHPPSPDAGRSNISQLLTEKIIHRPTLQELHQQHIL